MHAWPKWAKYAAACGIVAAILPVAFALQSLVPPGYPYLPFLLAILLAGSLFDQGSGFVAVGLSALFAAAPGAEALLGQGDMLHLAPGTGYPTRVHGAFVSDDEVHRVVEHLKATGAPQRQIQAAERALTALSRDPQALFLHLLHMPAEGVLHTALKNQLAGERRTAASVQVEERALLASPLSPEAYLA